MSVIDRFLGRPSYEPGDLVEFIDQDGQRQYGTYVENMAGGVAVEQQTGPQGLHGFKRVVRPAKPEPKDGG